MHHARARPDRATDGGASRWFPERTPLNARLVLLGSWGVITASVLLNAVGRPGVAGGSVDVLQATARTVVFSAAAVLFARLQLRLVKDRADPRQVWELLVLGFVPFGWGSTGEPTALGFAAALICLPARQSLPTLVATVVGFFLLFPEGSGVTEVTAAAAVVQLVVIGTVFAVITQLAITLDRLQRAREQLVRHRVELERERVARDLHDLMGRTLVTASLRCETLFRTVNDERPELRARIGRLRHTLSQGQTRVRALTSGPTISGWADEVESSRALCTRLGIEFLLVEEHDIADEHIQLAALLLRESMTTAVSDPRTRRVEVRLARASGGADFVTVTHDGRDPHAGPPDLPERLVDAVDRSGGTIAVSTDEGKWAVEVRLPAHDAVRPT